MNRFSDIQTLKELLEYSERRFKTGMLGNEEIKSIRERKIQLIKESKERNKSGNRSYDEVFKLKKEMKETDKNHYLRLVKRDVRKLKVFKVRKVYNVKNFKCLGDLK